MSSISGTRRRLDSARTLQGVVTTMKTLSAVRITQYRRSVAALSESTRTLELAAQALLMLQPELLQSADTGERRSVALVVLGSDRGLCGPFNERISRHAAGLLGARVAEGSTPAVLAVGRRLTARFAGLGIGLTGSVNPPGSVDAIDSAVVDVLEVLEKWQAEGKADQLWLAHNRPTRGAAFEPVAVRILPVDEQWLKRMVTRKWPSGRLPVALGDTSKLLRGLVRQFIVHTLVRGFAASQASENAARLEAMDAAEKNIEERLGQLNTLYRQARQNAVTAELLDVQAAFVALED